MTFAEILNHNVATLRMVKILATDGYDADSSAQVNAIIHTIPLEQRHNVIASDVVLLASLIRQVAQATGREPAAIIDEIAGAFSLAITESES